jgi:hypothetical protein
MDVAEPLENSNISEIMCTKFHCSDPKIHESVWTMTQIKEMSTRDLIAAVFQNIREKIKNRK